MSFGVSKNHWREYVSEAIGLGAFMISACAFSVLFFHRNSFASGWNTQSRFVLMGVAMGATALVIFLSPFGKLSGAHINPSVTLAFFRLRKIRFADTVFYVLAQFIGATVGVLLSWLLFRESLSAKEVNFAVTIPNGDGELISFVAEFGISFLMMTMVLFTTNHAKLSRFTPFIAGAFVATYIALEAPISGMSMNPARTFASAIFSGVWDGWWIYFLAPPLAMLSAAEIFIRLRGIKKVYCAKFYHYGAVSCIFDCRFDELMGRTINQRALTRNNLEHDL